MGVRASVSTACFVPSEAACIVAAMHFWASVSLARTLVAAARVQ